MSFKLANRWTKRGIKKCPKCGTENGQRSKRCKNLSCQQVPEAPPSTITKVKASRSATFGGHFVAVQLKQQDASVQLFSVRQQDGVRGFVEIRDCFDSGGAGLNEDLVLQLKTGVCYVDCHPHTGPEGTCQHVRAASESTEVGEELAIQREVLELLALTADERELIWKQQLRFGPGGPLVQKVAEDTFVVRCDDELHQLVPFCHVQLKQPSSSINYDCQAKATSDQTTPCYHAHIVAAAILSSPKLRPIFESVVKHLLLPPVPTPQDEQIKLLDSMILVPDSFPPLDATDQFLVTTIENLPEPPSETPVSSSPIIELINSTENSTSIGEAFTSVYDEHENIQLMECQIELMDQFMLTDQIDFCPSDVELSDENVVFPADEELGLVVDDTEVPKEPAPKTKSSKLVEVTTKKAALRQTSKVAKEKLKKGSYNVRRLMKILESNGVVFNRIKRSEAAAMAVGSAAEGGSVPSHEASLCGLTFTGWLESVIERINSVIHYVGNGKPDTLMFSIHETFFQCLRSRFSVGHRLRMPEHSYELEEPRRGLTCQVYKFSCYRSLRHVFKTDRIALKFEKSFRRAADGSFVEIDLSDGDGSSKVGRPIRAHEFTTYVKMGSYRREEDAQVHYFVIEWIAGVLPVSRFGEMRISFEYGHRENRVHVEPPTTASDKGISVSSKNE
ncbi:hypothetical protein pipiens_001565 [Culex pipiens pipiens]|uniref:Putative treble-clef zinc-finger domain-containing protein n=1 Tax=Culex pipiens pipiens TaxID=38569 RepID=A0ABD1CK90_CULPP